MITLATFSVRDSFGQDRPHTHLGMDVTALRIGAKLRHGHGDCPDYIVFCACRDLIDLERSRQWGLAVDFTHEEEIWKTPIERARPTSDVILFHALVENAIAGEFRKQATDYFFWEYFVRRRGGLHALQELGLKQETLEFYARTGWAGRRCESCQSWCVDQNYSSSGYHDEADEYHVLRTTRRCEDCGTEEAINWNDMLRDAFAPEPEKEP